MTLATSYLLIMLVKSERAWSYAMQLKDEMGESPRKKFHMHRKLHKAVQYSKQLEYLCNETADQRTILEAEVEDQSCFGLDFSRPTVLGCLATIFWRKKNGNLH